MSGGHESTEACLNGGGADTDRVGREIDAETRSDHHSRTIRCTECGREYRRVFAQMGAFNPEEGEYVPSPERFEEVNDAAYYDEGTYNIPITTADGRNLELVFIQAHLEHRGETIRTYDG